MFRPFLNTVMLLGLVCSFCCNASSQSIIGNWPLDDGDGVTINDSSGNGLNGTYKGLWAKGKFGNAVSMHGTKVTFNKQDKLQVADKSFTISCWLMPEKLQYDKKQKTVRVISALGKESLIVVDLENGGQPQLELGIKHKGKWSYGRVTATNKLEKNKWNYLTVVCDRQNLTLSIYINGKKDAEAKLPAAFKQALSPYTFMIGSPWQGYFGLMKNLVFSKTALTGQQIQQQYEAGKSKMGDTHYKFIRNPACIPQKRQDWSTSYAEWLRKRAKQGNIDVLFIGDSITHLWKKSGKWANGTKTWTKYYKPLKAENFGVAGDCTEHVLWRITEGEELEGINPKVIVLLIGTNNLHKKRNGVNDNARQIAEGIEVILETIKTKLPKTKILLLALFPRLDKSCYYKGKKVDDVNDLLPALTDNKQVFFLNINKHLLNPDGTSSKEILRDGLHLSEKGYEIWAGSMHPYLLDLLNNNGQGKMWQK